MAELMACTNSLPYFAHLEVSENNGSQIVVSSESVRAWRSLSSILSEPVDARIIARLTAQLHGLFEECAKNELFLKQLVLDNEFIFYCSETDEFKFIYLPFSDIPANTRQQLAFFKSLPDSFGSLDDATRGVLEDWRIKTETLRSFNPSAIQKILKETASDASVVAASAVQVQEDAVADSVTSGLRQEANENSGKIEDAALEEPLETTALENASNGMPEPAKRQDAYVPKHNGMKQPKGRKSISGIGKHSTAEPLTGVLNSPQPDEMLSLVAGEGERMSGEKRHASEQSFAESRVNGHSACPTTVLSAQRPSNTEDLRRIGQSFSNATVVFTPPVQLDAGGGMATRPIVSRPVQQQAMWVVVTRMRTGEQFEVHGDRFVVGKSKYATFQVTSTTTVSRQHAVFGIDENGCWVIDNNSLNGTLVNGVPLVSGRKYQLKDGDTVQMSDEQFLVKIQKAM